MNLGTPASNDTFTDRVNALRVQVQFAVLMGGMGSVVQECLQELRRLTSQPVTLKPAALNP